MSTLVSAVRFAVLLLLSRSACAYRILDARQLQVSGQGDTTTTNDSSPSPSPRSWCLDTVCPPGYVPSYAAQCECRCVAANNSGPCVGGDNCGCYGLTCLGGNCCNIGPCTTCNINGSCSSCPANYVFGPSDGGCDNVCLWDSPLRPEWGCAECAPNGACNRCRDGFSFGQGGCSGVCVSDTNPEVVGSYGNCNGFCVSTNELGPCTNNCMCRTLTCWGGWCCTGGHDTSNCAGCGPDGGCGSCLEGFVLVNSTCVAPASAAPSSPTTPSYTFSQSVTQTCTPSPSSTSLFQTYNVGNQAPITLDGFLPCSGPLFSCAGNTSYRGVNFQGAVTFCFSYSPTIRPVWFAVFHAMDNGFAATITWSHDPDNARPAFAVFLDTDVSLLSPPLTIG
jgi:hypothetical protein